jgi:hypothetical protein
MPSLATDQGHVNAFLQLQKHPSQLQKISFWARLRCGGLFMAGNFSYSGAPQRRGLRALER